MWEYNHRLCSKKSSTVLPNMVGGSRNYVNSYAVEDVVDTKASLTANVKGKKWTTTPPGLTSITVWNCLLEDRLQNNLTLTNSFKVISDQPVLCTEFISIYLLQTCERHKSRYPCCLK